MLQGIVRPQLFHESVGDSRTVSGIGQAFCSGFVEKAEGFFKYKPLYHVLHVQSVVYLLQAFCQGFRTEFDTFFHSIVQAAAGGA